MTQNPIFYENPRPGRSPWRTAAILQSICGAVMLLFSTCAGTFALFFWQILDMLQQQGQTLPMPPDVTPQMARMFLITGSIFLAGVGFVLLTLAVFVRRGNKMATIFSCIVMGLIGVLLVFDSIGAILSPAGNIVQGILSILLCLAMLSLCGYTLIKLLTLATSSAPPATIAARQYWAIAQQGNMGFGYGFPPQWMPPPGAPPVGMPPQATTPPPQIPQPPLGG